MTCVLVKDHHGHRLEVGCCGLTFFVIATVLIGYDNKKMFTFNIIRNDVPVMSGFFGNFNVQFPEVGFAITKIET